MEKASSFTKRFIVLCDSKIGLAIVIQYLLTWTWIAKICEQSHYERNINLDATDGT